MPGLMAVASSSAQIRRLDSRPRPQANFDPRPTESAVGVVFGDPCLYKNSCDITLKSFPWITPPALLFEEIPETVASKVVLRRNNQNVISTFQSSHGILEDV